MGLHRWWQVTLIIVSLFLSSLSVDFSQAYHDHEALDDFLRKQANKEIKRYKTGVFYNVSLPSNFTGMGVSVIRLRNFSLWSRGVNYTFVTLPPRIVPRPNRKRMAILFENLGNWSSHYYNVPNHTMVAPVFGIMAYSSSERALVDENIKFTAKGDPIRIWFPHVEKHYGKNNTPICIKFSTSGVVKFRNMTKPFVCEVHTQGHYTIVVPSFHSPEEPKSETSSHSKRFATWWVLGFLIGFVGLFILALILIVLVKVAKKRRIKKMEKNSEGGELFDTFWMGDTKLPSASMIRTQPTLEH